MGCYNGIPYTGIKHIDSAADEAAGSIGRIREYIGYILTSDFDDFAKYSDIKTIEDLSKLSKDDVVKEITKYLTQHAIDMRVGKRQESLSELQGFNSTEALKIAKDYVKHGIDIIFTDELSKPKSERLTRDKIVREFIKVYSKNLLNQLVDLYNENSQYFEDSCYPKNAIGYNEEEDSSENSEEIEDAFYEKLADREDARETAVTTKELEDYKKAFDIEMDFFDYLSKFNTKYSTMIANKLNLLRILTNKSEVNLKDFLASIKVSQNDPIANILNGNETFIVDNIETLLMEDLDVIGGEELEMTPDELATKFMENNVDSRIFISNDVKLLLRNIPLLTELPQSGSDKLVYDRNNELGVAQYIPYNKVFSDLISMKANATIDDFLAGIEKLAKRNSKNYGYIVLYNILKNDPIRLSRLFYIFSNRYVSKLQVRVDSVQTGNENTTALAKAFYSNAESDRESSVYRNLEYNIYAISRKINDKDSELLTKIFKQANDSKADVETLSDCIRKCNVYLPKIDISVVESMIAFNSKKDLEEYKAFVKRYIKTVKTLVDGLLKALNEQSKIDKAHKEAWEAYRKEGKENAAIVNTAEYKSRKPGKKKHINLRTELSNPINVLKDIFLDFDNSYVKYNSLNAEGNSSASVIEMSHIGKLEQMMSYGKDKDAEDEDYLKGLRKLKNDLSRGAENQHNPLLWGIRDDNGELILDSNGEPLYPGMFTRVGENTGIEETGAYIPEFYPFDGVKNNIKNEGKLYKGLDKLDFFRTQLSMFLNPDSRYNPAINELIKRGKKGVYFIPTPSDAGRTECFIGPKFEIKDMVVNGEWNRKHPINVAFKTILQEELEFLIEQLQNICDFNKHNKTRKLTIKKNTKGYIPGFNCDKKGTSFVEIGKDGKLYLSGRVFKSSRLIDGNIDINTSKLFELPNYSAGSVMVDMILYGESGILKEYTDRSGNKSFYINESSDFIEVSPDGTLSLKNTEITNEMLWEISKNWLNNFAYSVEGLLANEYLDIKEEYNYATIMDFVINNALNQMLMTPFLNGNESFYKNSRDTLKRAKQVMAGGQNYTNNNMDSENGEAIRDMEGINVPILKEDGTPYMLPRREGNEFIEMPIRPRTKFRGVTFANSVRALDKEAQQIYDIIVNATKKKYPDENSNNYKLGLAAAERIAANYGNFKDINGKPVAIVGDKTKTNDAQSYITFDEFIQRSILDGSYREYEDLFNILIPINELALQPLAENETFADRYNKIQKELNKIDFNKLSRVQVRKNFYYDIVWDDFNKCHTPRQIKNSEFVIIPALCYGTDLLEVYKAMKEHDIAQINSNETSKASTKNVVTIWDNDGNFNFNAEEAFDEINVNEYGYENLFQQLEVPSHLKDEENKFPIQLSRKIQDNKPVYDITKDSPHRRIMELQVANIQESFEDMLDRMNWKIEDNKVVNKDGSAIKFHEFYKRAKDELIRTSADSNLLDCVEEDENGDTKIPLWFNMDRAKMESVAQALFNTSITRQKFPGFHATQVTPIGFGLRTSTGEVRELKYHEKEGVVEIMIPRWKYNIPKTTSIEEEQKLIDALNEAGVCDMIGLRMPTEAKYSVAKFKVVGFIDDVYDSTIFVPDAWVKQTGSDFDVDSIYTLVYDFTCYKDKNGNFVVTKKEMPESIEDKYKMYVKEKLNTTADRVTKEEIDAEIVNLKNQRNNRIQSSLKEYNKDEKNEAFKNLHKQDKSYVVETHDNLKADGYSYKERLDKEINYLRKRIIELDKGGGTEKTDRYIALENYINMLQDIQKFYEQVVEQENENYKSTVSDYFEGVEQANFDYYEKAATKVNGMTFDEFKEFMRNNPDWIPRSVRNNRILDNMRIALSEYNAIQENFAGSAYDDIRSAIKKVDKLLGRDKRPRSMYNPFDQLDWFEDAMGGATLKGISVTRDNVSSLFNASRARLNGKGIIYDGKTYDRLNNNDNDNKRDDGIFLTIYASQTTPHILDAIKEGSMYNENTYTFGIFRTIIDLGIDIDYSAKFIATPAVSRIIKYNNSKTSLYGEDARYNPVFEVIKDMLKELGIVKQDVYFKNVEMLADICAKRDLISKDAAKKLEPILARYGYDSIMDLLKNKYIKFDSKLIDESFETVNENEEERAIHNFINAVHYAKINEITSFINAIAQVTNPEKYGAKPTIYDTKLKIEGIAKYYGKTDIIVGPEIYGLPADSDQKISFLSALFPGFNKSQPYNLENINIDRSFYPYLAAYLKYATIPSVVINSQLFLTENESFDKIIETAKSMMGAGVKEEVVQELKDYIIATIYSDLSIISCPVGFDKYGYYKLEGQTIENKEKEELRIRGIISVDNFRISNVTTRDFSENTEENAKDIKRYMQLSPVDKIKFLQNNFINYLSKDIELIKYINAGYFLNKDRDGGEIDTSNLTINEQYNDIEELRNMFKRMIYSSNPLFRLAALDIIKYHFLVNKGRYTRDSIGKIIPNDVLYTSIDSMGVELVEECKAKMQNYVNNIDTLINEGEIRKIITDFVRSKDDSTPIVTIPNKDERKRDTESIPVENMSAEDEVKAMERMMREANGETIEEETKVTKLQQMIDAYNAKEQIYGIKVLTTSSELDKMILKRLKILSTGDEGNYTGLNYIRVRHNYETILYKIIKGEEIQGEAIHYYLVPLTEYDNGRLKHNRAIDGNLTEGDYEKLCAQLDSYYRGREIPVAITQETKEIQENFENGNADIVLLEKQTDMLRRHKDLWKTQNAEALEILERNGGYIGSLASKCLKQIKKNEPSILIIPKDCDIVLENIKPLVKYENGKYVEHDKCYAIIYKGKTYLLSPVSYNSSFNPFNGNNLGLYTDKYIEEKRKEIDKLVNSNGENIAYGVYGKNGRTKTRVYIVKPIDKEIILGDYFKELYEAEKAAKEKFEEDFKQSQDNTDAAMQAMVNAYEKQENETQLMDEENNESLYGNSTRQSTYDNIEENDPITDMSSFSELATYIHADVNDRRIKKINEIADKFSLQLQQLGVDWSDRDSVAEHLGDIYDIAAVFYEKVAEEIINNLMFYKTENGETFNLAESKIYNYLGTHTDEIYGVCRALLEAKTFGNKIADIMKVDLLNAAADLSKPIERIQKAIERVKTNKVLNIAFDVFFNSYCGKYLSNNPLIKQGIVKVTDIIGDDSWIHSQFGDVINMNHKQVQIILKLVNAVISEAEHVTAPNAIDKFFNECKTLFNIKNEEEFNKAIDRISINGKLLRKYTPKFEEDRDNYERRLREENKGTLSWWKLKLEYDEWKVRNLEQEMTDDYYEARNKVLRDALEKCPYLFVQYQELRQELISLNEIPDEEYREARKQEIYSMIDQLKKGPIVDGKRVKLDKQMLAEARALNDYIIKTRQINNMAFKYEATEAFKNELNTKKEIIRRYNSDQKYEGYTFEQKMNEFPEYEQAYNWLAENTQFRLDDELHYRVINALSILSYNSMINKADMDRATEIAKERDLERVTKEFSVTLKYIDEQKKLGKKMYDEYGHIIANNFTDEQIENIKIEQLGNMMKNVDGPAMNSSLCKNLKGIPYMDSPSKEYMDEWAKQHGEIDWNNSKRLEVIYEINKILERYMDEYGNVAINALCNNYQDTTHLNSLYAELRDLNQGILDEFEGDKDPNVGQLLNYKAFIKDSRSVANQNNFFRTFAKAVTENDAKQFYPGKYTVYEGIYYVPNSLYYGTYVVKNHNATITSDDGTKIPIVNSRVSEAKNFIRNNIEFRPTSLYYEEKEKHAGDNEWYSRNHYYDPYTHMMQPLKIWTTAVIRPDADIFREDKYKDKEIDDLYDYMPTYENTHRFAKDEHLNDKFDRESSNYKYETGDYNNPQIAKLSKTDESFLSYMQTLMNKLASGNYSMRQFASDGYLPSFRKPKENLKIFRDTLKSIAGVNWHKSSTEPWHTADYEHDATISLQGMELLADGEMKKRKQQLLDSRKDIVRSAYNSDEEYNEALNNWRKNLNEVNKEIEEYNNDSQSKDWASIFKTVIRDKTIADAKEKAKMPYYLLLEDIKDREVPELNLFGNLTKDRKHGFKDSPIYKKGEQRHTLEILMNLGNRIFFQQYHKGGKLRDIANALQTFTSAKYMQLNLYSAVSNISTGYANIWAERMAKEYFSGKELAAASGDYFKNILNIIANIWSDKASTKTEGLIKFFNIVDYENVEKFRSGEISAEELQKRITSFMYSTNSGGEHMMQNTVLLACLKSNRLYVDRNGNTVFGTFDEYSNEVEFKVLKEMCQEDEKLTRQYEDWNRKRADMQFKYEIDKGKTNFARDFVRRMVRLDFKDKSFIKEFNDRVNEAKKKLKEEWLSDEHPTMEDQFELVNGKIQVKEQCMLRNGAGELIGNLVGAFAKKVIAINKRIHGSYDKEGAAMAEHEWWGSILMQYHKHIPIGISKRFSSKGYYNESRGTYEVGSYVQTWRFLTMGYKDAIEDIKEKEGDITFAKAIANLGLIAAGTFTGLVSNWNSLSSNERANIRRALGDFMVLAGGIILTAAIYALWDDDEIKDSKILSSIVYALDRWYAETAAYNLGARSEARTLYSSPIAVGTSVADFVDVIELLPQLLLGKDLTYTSGIYKGRNKLSVKLGRNIPLYRQLQRYNNITKSNHYFRLEDSNLNLKLGKAIGRIFNPQ